MIKPPSPDLAIRMRAACEFTSAQLKRFAQATREAQGDAYRQAGCPYGDTEHGFRVWVRENFFKKREEMTTDDEPGRDDQPKRITIAEARRRAFEASERMRQAKIEYAEEEAKRWCGYDDGDELDGPEADQKGGER